jgi:2-polyprenyl-6-methoxyphenol hydroxylase-like FAD-dependent oxidoreductase
MRVIVVGGGIGGLGAAIALGRAGHQVVVLERTARLASAGAGITLFANAMRALDRLGVGDAVRAGGAPAKHSAILTSSGRQLLALPGDLLEGAVAIRRSDLQTALQDAAQGVRLGAVVTSVELAGDGATAKIEDGTEEHGDLLIGADGVRSLVRAAVAPAQPRYAGYTAWRGIAPALIQKGQLTESWGVGERFGLVDVGLQTYWFATANAREADPEQARERKPELMRRFASWHAPIGAILEATPEGAILRNDVYYLDPLARWSRGRIVLLGDAAHATTPGSGQGAAQALEDAVALAHALGEGVEIEDALARYESIRRPRADLTQKLSRQDDRAAQLANPLGCRLRNAIASHIPAGFQRRQLAPLVLAPSPEPAASVDHRRPSAR